MKFLNKLLNKKKCEFKNELFKWIAKEKEYLDKESQGIYSDYYESRLTQLIRIKVTIESENFAHSSDFKLENKI